MRSVFANRSERAKLRFTGSQRAWFLHQVLTHSFEDIRPGEARAAAMLTAHGRMVGFLEVVATPDALLAHLEPELRTVLPEALSRYVFATDVAIDDVTESWGLVLVAGEGWERSVAVLDGVVHPTHSLGIPAAYVWVGPSALGAAERALEESGVTRVDEDALEALRVRHGAPRWGREMTPKSLPQEVGIDALAVHYDKGCYLGQEAMAKIHFRGRVGRRLRRLTLAGDAGPGQEVTRDGGRVGTVTSVADGHALAVLKRDVERGAVVRAGAAEATVSD